ncbi:MAG: DNA-binding protein [Nanoarchaeota archaeon]|nr:DNA-binding protein [Nanoarchaeota archaeon]MBU0978143.1 DNA-binding protein [Nanoarchaeota archaeon]
MKLIVDANIMISALVNFKGKTRALIFLDELELLAPEFLISEIEEHKNEIAEKTKISYEELTIALNLTFSRIKLIPFEEFSEFIQKAKEVCPDPDDEEYLALALSKNLPIWSDDTAIRERQNTIKVYTTTELIGMFFVYIITSQ